MRDRVREQVFSYLRECEQTQDYEAKGLECNRDNAVIKKKTIILSMYHKQNKVRLFNSVQMRLRNFVNLWNCSKACQKTPVLSIPITKICGTRHIDRFILSFYYSNRSKAPKHLCIKTTLS